MSVAEARRQQALLAALAADGATAADARLRETGPRASDGLDAYRRNASAIAERALAAAFPTVQAMLGHASFARVGERLWHEHPPGRGDLAEWGGALPAWLDAEPAMSAWPYLGDSARLDWARHQCERAADAAFDAASLALLESTDPSALWLRLMPGTQVIESAWPILTIHEAHRSPDEAGFDAVRAALAEGRGQTVIVARDGWRAAVRLIDAPTAAWTRALLSGESVAEALDGAGPHFDFAAWLGTALRASWVKDAARSGDRKASTPGARP